MSKRKAGWDVQDRQKAAAATHTVTFLPDGQTVTVPDDSTLLEAAQAEEIHVNASCSGKGSCGKCEPVVVAGKEATAPPVDGR
jgi:ferredoxin